VQIDWIVAAGCASLGALLGALIRYYVNEAEKMTYQVLIGSVSVFAGAGVIAVFHLIGGQHPPLREYWFYPMGLLAGFAFVALFDGGLPDWSKRD